MDLPNALLQPLEAKLKSISGRVGLPNRRARSKQPKASWPPDTGRIETRQLKPREEWPDKAKAKDQVIEDIHGVLKDAPGNNFEFTQPIQMRFNELISGVRSDVAVKVYGDDFKQMEKTAMEISKTLQSTNGAADVKVEQTSGLPFLEIQLKKDAIALYGLNVSDVLEVIQIAIGGREAGLVFQGDSRYDILVRMPETLRTDLDAIGNLPIRLPEDEGQGDDAKIPHARPNFVPLKQVANLVMSEGQNQISRENGKRRIVVQAPQHSSRIRWRGCSASRFISLAMKLGTHGNRSRPRWRACGRTCPSRNFCSMSG